MRLRETLSVELVPFAMGQAEKPVGGQLCIHVVFEDTCLLYFRVAGEVRKHGMVRVSAATEVLQHPVEPSKKVFQVASLQFIFPADLHFFSFLLVSHVRE